MTRDGSPVFKHRNPRYFRVGQGLRKPYIGKSVINTIVPDHAEIKVGGPAPLPQARVEWDREKKERISQLRRRLNA